jgi:hypothetical protein
MVEALGARLEDTLLLQHTHTAADGVIHAKASLERPPGSARGGGAGASSAGAGEDSPQPSWSASATANYTAGCNSAFPRQPSVCSDARQTQQGGLDEVQQQGQWQEQAAPKRRRRSLPSADKQQQQQGGAALLECRCGKSYKYKEAFRK